MAKRGLKKGSKCVRKNAKTGRCAEFGHPGGKVSKAKKKPKKGSWLEQMERRYKKKGKDFKMYTSAGDFTERMRKDREAAQEAKLRKNIESFSPMFGARSRRRSR